LKHKSVWLETDDKAVAAVCKLDETVLLSRNASRINLMLD